MTNKRIYYKCLTHDHLSLMSCSDEVLSIHYKLGEWVYPKIKGTKLMVFDSLENVKRSQLIPIYIYECEVINPKKIGFFVTGVWSNGASSKFFNKLKRKNSKKKYLYHEDRSQIPRGTVFCDAVKLTKLHPYNGIFLNEKNINNCSDDKR